MNQNRPLFVVLLVLLGTTWLQAQPLRVPANYASIQAAIDASQAGAVIVVSAGIYRERLVLKPGIRLISEGGPEKGKQGLLRAEKTVIEGTGGKGPGVMMAEGATIDGFTVTGVGAYDEERWQKHWTDRGENQSHEHIGGFGEPGIGADGVSCRIVNCIVHHNGGTGIALRGAESGAADPIVKSNICYRNMGGGIGLMRGVGGIVRSNTCYENFYAGIGHSAGACPLVVDNKCYGNVRAGIGVSEGSCPIVRNNRCSRNRRAGIGIRTGAKTRPVIEGNECTENGMAGIGSEEEAEPIIRNNNCEKNAEAGIGARKRAKPIVVENRCLNNEAAGIGLREGCEGVLVRNTCEGNKLVAIGLPKDGKAIIVENLLSRVGGIPPLVAIRGGSHAILHRNRLEGGGVAGILVEGGAILSGNRIAGRNDKFGQGVWLWKGSKVLAEDNTSEGFKNKVSLAPESTWTGERP